MDNTLAVDLETACNVAGCKHYGQAICSEDHSLSPWHSKITVIGVYGKIKGSLVKRVFREVDSFSAFYSNCDSVVNFVGHNFKFDLLHLHAKGINIDLARWTSDSQLAAYVLTDKIPDEWIASYNAQRKQIKGYTREGTKHSLKTLAPYLLGVNPFWEASSEGHDSDEYVLKDCRYTYRLCGLLEEKLSALGQFEFYKEKQLPWAKLLLRAEMRGLKIDVEGIDILEADYKQALETLERKLDVQWHEAHVAYTNIQLEECKARYESMSEARGAKLEQSERYSKLYQSARAKIRPGIDYASAKQMLWLLRDYYGYNCTSLEGKEGTGREILERLANEGKEDVKRFLEYRKVQKILTGFLPTYKGLQVGSVIRPIYNPDSTRTGRTSSQRPNLQQVPPSLRGLFVARQGYTLVGYDAAAIEAKLICLYTSDPNLYSIVSSGTSLHDHNTKVFFGLGADVPLTSIKTEYANERAATKNVGFALFYNAGANRIRITFANKGFHLSDYECKELLQRFRAEYQTAVKVGMEYVQELETGAVMTNLLGRPVKIQNPDDAYMTAFNTLIQGSASDLNIEAARRTQDEFDAIGLDAHVVGFVHDFVMVEAHDSVKDQAEAILVKHMTGFKLECELGPIELTVEGSQMKRWEK